MAKWIWRFGEFETYHNLQLHSRRQAYGYSQPCMWKLYTPEPVVQFNKKTLTDGGKMYIRACGFFTTEITMNGDMWSKKEYYGRTEIDLPSGDAEINIRVENTETFPCIYVWGAVESDETWLSDDITADRTPVGSWDVFDDPDVTPEFFPFNYEPITYAAKKPAGSGVLFDFGKETFAETVISGLTDEKVTVQFGESEEEAMDPEWSVIHFTEEPEDGVLAYNPYAFRYIYVSDPNAEISAEYEYLPLEKKGAFSCDNEMMNRIWDTAAYTFHLNSREFFLDGIKRDRWVWSADAYQSLFVAHSLFMDPEIEKRTLIALGGKQPVKGHINTIMDYTFFWMISLYEYYLTYGDKKFLEGMEPQLQAEMDFCLGRRDKDGFMREKPGDWIFIDWAPMDKTGALCGEQILFAKALDSYSRIMKVIGRDDCGRAAEAEALRRAIFEKFYDPELGVFVDSYESGKKSVTRHSNILAYLFLPCSEEQKNNIYHKVILNDEVRAITTPYFKFYENQVYCLQGAGAELEQSILDYYGSMLELGATTLYEEYDPNMKGAEHYAMYGRPYEKSLCHAWSCSPIYFMAAFRMGVKNTGVAYDTFEVRPALGGLKQFEGIVPLPDGDYVKVAMDGAHVSVTASKDGGTLYFGGKEAALPAGKTITL